MNFTLSGGGGEWWIALGLARGLTVASSVQADQTGPPMLVQDDRSQEAAQLCLMRVMQSTTAQSGMRL